MSLGKASFELKATRPFVVAAPATFSRINQSKLVSQVTRIYVEVPTSKPEPKGEGNFWQKLRRKKVL